MSEREIVDIVDKLLLLLLLKIQLYFKPRTISLSLEFNKEKEILLEMQQQQLYEGRKQTTAPPRCLSPTTKQCGQQWGNAFSSLSCEASNICLLSPFYLAHFWPTILIIIIISCRRRPSNEEGIERPASPTITSFGGGWVGGQAGSQAKQMSPREGKHSHSHSTVTQMKPGDWGSVSCYFCYCCCC